MRLTIKTTLVMFVAFCLLLTAYGSYELNRQTEAAENQLRASQRTLGRLFRPTIARTWRTDGEVAALYLIAYTEETLREEGVVNAFDLRWIWLDAEEGSPHAPLAPVSALAAMGSGKELTLVLNDDDDDDNERMVSYVPLALGIDGERPGALEISGSLAPLRSFASEARRRLFVTVVAGVGALALLSLGIGAWMVGRPVRRLVEATQRIGRGDLETRVEIRARDELGRVARAIDDMAAGLGAARREADRATEARIRAVEQMRHADRLVTVGQLASGMAHELGTPLAVVAGRARLIANRTVEAEEAIEYAESIERQAERMTAIIRQLLDFARRRSVTMTPKDLGALVRQTMDLLHNMADKKQVELRAELPDQPLTAPVDGAQIQQVLTNLVVNAIQASATGGAVTVAVATTTREPPQPSTAARSRYVRIAVRDHGCGMTAEVAARVFEPFFTTKDVGEGTGLGLSVSHGIVSDHGGWIDVVSEPGAGACFSVYLPIGVEAP